MKKSKLVAVIVLLFCISGLATMMTWPHFKEGSWQTVSVPAWWQFEWLAAIGFCLSALPSIAVAYLSEVFELNEYFRYVISGFLIFLEIIVISFVVYKIVERFKT
jgi:MFS family permease